MIRERWYGQGKIECQLFTIKSRVGFQTHSTHIFFSEDFEDTNLTKCPANIELVYCKKINIKKKLMENQR